MYDLTSRELVNLTAPFIDTIYPISIALGMIIFGLWLSSKLIAYSLKKETLTAIVIKTVTFFAFLFFWKAFFFAGFYFFEACEAKVYEIDMSSTIPDYIGENQSTTIQEVMQNMYSDYQIAESVNDYTNEEQLRDIQEKYDQYQKEDGEIGVLNKLKKMMETLNVKASGIATSAVNNTLLRVINFRAWVKGLAGGIAIYIYDTYMMIRAIMMMFFLIMIPPALILSYIPILGGSEEGATNKYIKTLINLTANILSWPVVFGIIGKLYISIYYAFYFKEYLNTLGSYLTFFWSYIIIIGGIPFLLQKGNVYGIVHGTISAVSTSITAATMASQFGVSTLSKSAGRATGSNLKASNPNNEE